MKEDKRCCCCGRHPRRVARLDMGGNRYCAKCYPNWVSKEEQAAVNAMHKEKSERVRARMEELMGPGFWGE